MEYQALYRKYRPTKFSDVVEQENILKVITNSIKENKVSHAYLFSGPRGTGKTTIAKLLAKTVNCLNIQEDFSVCGCCENCLDIENNSSDIIEIDAASNNGVDEIRELKSKINLVPGKLKYKIYIIDEVHMLSISAFNALLKTLEEPPSHVIFVLATTEFYKVPITIVSRCQCLNFKKLKNEGIEKRLKKVAELEKINISDEAIREIAVYSDGGMRDALGMLDKLASYSLEKIEVSDFLQINGLISKHDIQDFIGQIINKENQKVIETLTKFDEDGYDFSKLTEKIMQELRDLLVSNYTTNEISYDSKKIYELIICFNEIYNLLKEAANRKIIVEVKLLSFMNEVIEVKTIIQNKEKKEVMENNISQEIFKSKKNVLTQQKNLGNENKNESFSSRYKINDQIKQIRINNTFAMASKMLKNMMINKWSNLTIYLSDNKFSQIAGLLKDCNIGVVSNTNLILFSKYSSIIDKIYLNFELAMELINLIAENSYDVVLLTEDEFKTEVSNYKLHMNEKDYYSYKKEEEPFINFFEQVENTSNMCYGNLVQRALDVFGKELVEIE